MAIAAEASGCGAEFKKLRSQGKSAAEAYAQLAAEGEISATAFSNMWGSVEAGTGALAILQTDAAEMQSTLAAMADSAGTTQSAYETMTQTLRHSWDTLKNELKNLGISMFEQLGTPLSNAVDAIGQAVGKIAESFGSGEGGLNTIVSGAASAIQSFADGVNTVVTGIEEGAFTDTIEGLSGAFGGIGDAVEGFIEDVGQINTSEVLASAVVAVGLVSDAISSVIMTVLGDSFITRTFPAVRIFSTDGRTRRVSVMISLESQRTTWVFPLNSRLSSNSAVEYSRKFPFASRTKKGIVFNVCGGISNWVFLGYSWKTSQASLEGVTRTLTSRFHEEPRFEAFRRNRKLLSLRFKPFPGGPEAGGDRRSRGHRRLLRRGAAGHERQDRGG